MFKPLIKNCLYYLMLFSICAPLLASSGCTKKTSPAEIYIEQIKSISEETKNYYNSIVTREEQPHPTAEDVFQASLWFDEKLQEVRAIRQNALADTKIAGENASYLLRACATAENYLVSMKESFRRYAAWDESSSIPLLDLSKAYYDEIFSLTPDKEHQNKHVHSGATRQNILIILVDTLRADHTGFSGYSRNITPFLDTLADESLVFTNTFSQAPHTPPSVASLLTGEYPSHHGLVTACEWKKEHSLVKVLKEVGYDTVAFSANPIINSENGYDEGFDVFVHRPEAISEILINEFFTWLGTRNSDKPFFAYLHLMDPHDSYDAPPPFNGTLDPGYPRRFFTSWIYDVTLHDINYESDPDSVGWIDENEIYKLVQEQSDKEFSRRDLDNLIAFYDEEIAYTDDSLRRMFDVLKRNNSLNNLTVVFTADHGESFLEHGFMEHGTTLYDEALHVPLFFWDNGKTFKPGRDTSIVETVDIMPTIFNAVGINAFPEIDGRSLVGKSLGISKKQATGATYSSTWYGRSFRQKKDITKFAVRTEKYKFIYTPDPLLYELYDLETDKHEKSNLLTSNGNTTPDEIGLLLENYVKSFDWMKEEGTLKDNPKMLKDMKSLGYVR